MIVTPCKFEDKIFLDPNASEEKVLTSKLSVGVREDGMICALQKQGKELEFDEITKMVEIAIEKSKELRKLCQ